MAKLMEKARKKLPEKDFGEPKERKYPMEDKTHARDAKARASEMEHKGKLSGAAEKAIDRKADRVIERMTKRKPPR